jgi:hypothetical protein
MGYETAGYIPFTKLKDITDKRFWKIVHRVENDHISVGLFSLLSELKLYGLYDEFVDDVTRIHGNLSRPSEVKEEYVKMLKLIIKHMEK